MNGSRTTATSPKTTCGNAKGRLLAVAVSAAGWLATASSANAAGLNDPGCKPTAEKPYPVVVVHGQAGAYEGMVAITSSLADAGYCVYARNYGRVPGGANGQDHLSTSADQIGVFVDEILKQTGAPKVSFVSHSAGTGVVDNYIQKKGGAAKVHREVSFGGLHHPYAHVGVANTLDATLYLPHLISAARVVAPGISAQHVVKAALGLYTRTGSPLGMVDPSLRATMESNFTSDLFDPTYWKDLQGGQSEGALSFIQVGRSKRSRQTNDADPNVCYTNIVAIGDPVAGATAGFQDEAPNVENFLLTSSSKLNAHGDMLVDPNALQKMLTRLAEPCAVAPPRKTLAGSYDGPAPTADDDDAANAFKSTIADEADLDPSTGGQAAGCSVSHDPTTPAGGLLAVGIALVACTRRRRVSSGA